MPHNPTPVFVNEIVAGHAGSVASFLQDRFSQLAADIDEAVAGATRKTRLAASEEFNQLMRRLRQCRSTEEVASWLVDSTSAFCGCAALFEVVAPRVRGVIQRGFQTDGGAFEQLEMTLDAAPAFAHAVQERDTVIALGSPAEVSPQVASALGQASSGKVHLFPIEIQDKVVAILCAVAGEGAPVDGAALELLAQAAGSAAQMLAPPEPAPRPA